MQTSHAALNFAVAYPELTERWHNISNYLICLSVPSLDHLKDLVDEVVKLKLRRAVFREPDLGGDITAVCIEPGQTTQKLCSNYKLTLRDHERNT